MLEERIQSKGMELGPLKFYVDSFRHGISPHAGAGIGLERVVFLYLGTGLNMFVMLLILSVASSPPSSVLLSTPLPDPFHLHLSYFHPILFEVNSPSNLNPLLSCFCSSPSLSSLQFFHLQ